MKFEISVIDYFSAAHNLRQYQGKCENIHGHNFKVKITLGANSLDKTGMVYDFHYVKEVLKKTLKVLDHSHLNKLPYFGRVNPTSENIAKFIFNKLKAKINKRTRKLIKVTVWETESNEASYQE
ncbi:MAG: 6-carboxytetrahydropterin synthase QueD [Candidatus Omnitrophica bacterium]|nr:6-carboxytetrahydropterin synthase QueD [Candidatus Omnitrophota bacterium]